MSNKKLSVIVPNYNHAQYIREALETILSQSFRPLEVIVVDNCSTDNSVEIIESIAKQDPIVRLLKNEHNKGMIYSFNRALKCALGDYIYSGNSDDRVLPGFFEKSIKLLAQYPQAGLCHGRILYIDEEGKVLSESKPTLFTEYEGYVYPEQIFAELRANLGLGVVYGNTAIVKRSALIETGGYIAELDAFNDGFMNMTIALKYGVCYIPEPLACWRRMEGGLSSILGRSVEKFVNVVSYAEQLMKSSKYSDLFPKDFVKEWKQIRLYELGKGLLDRGQSQQKSFLKDLKYLRQNPTFIDRIFSWGLTLWMRIQLLIIKLYLICHVLFIWRLTAIKLRLIYKRFLQKVNWT